MATLTGLIIPWHAAGTTSEGRITIAPGAIELPEDLSRIKLLREHDQAGDPIGYAISIVETDAGLVGVFEVPDTPAAQLALAEAADKLRDGLSAGIDFDDATKLRLVRASNASVAASGRLREVSLVVVPAFDDARIEAIA